MDYTTIGIITYLATVVLAIGWPFLNSYIKTGKKFEWRKALGKIVGALGGGLLIIINPEFTETLANLVELYDYPSLYVLAVGAIAWASTAVGHEGTKTATHTKSKLTTGE